jgi:hypothetical protein
MAAKRILLIEDDAHLAGVLLLVKGKIDNILGCTQRTAQAMPPKGTLPATSWWSGQ